MIFVFSALSEFVIVKVMEERYKLQKKFEEANRKDCQITPWQNMTGAKMDISHFQNRKYSIPSAWKDNAGQEKILWCEIDRVSRTLFPVLFLIFLILYWPLLTMGKS